MTTIVRVFKRLYPILIILLLVACDRVQTEVQSQAALPTVPVEWLTHPPTPPITRNAESAPAEQDMATETAEPQATAVMERKPTADPEATSTADEVFELPQLFGRQWTVSAQAGVPEELIAPIRSMVAARPDDYLWVEPGSLPTDITIKLDQGEQFAEWIYVVAAPFATVRDDVSEEELRAMWEAALPTDTKFAVDERSAAMLRRLWGTPGPAVTIVHRESLVDMLWEDRPALTVLPFDELTPDLKVLRLAGQSPLSPDYETESYPLAVSVGVEGEREALATFFAAWDGPLTNRDPQKLTRVAMTGVTALVRATATQMEVDGILTPATDVGPILRAADVAHISNEVSFAPDCPEPNPVGGTTFCSQDEYFALLDEIGTDVVELSGNHLNDWGSENLLRTIDMYEAAGMDYFGGGRNEADAGKAALIEHNDNRIALTGCNFFGPSYAWATADSAGSRQCGPDFLDQVRQLREQGYVVIATQQYTEFYQYPPTAEQQTDFQAIAAAGASAVSGSQGHHVQGFEFHNGSIIHYGLGNLFFDQMDMLGTRQAFVDTYAIYDGRLINVDLWTGLIENYFLPREMTAEERAQALESVFQASGW